MTTRKVSAITAVPAEPLDGDIVEPGDTGPVEHPLYIGDDVFACGEQLPLSTLIRYADDGLLSMHHILKKLVPEDEHERMWDAFEKLNEDDVTAAIKGLVETYSKRPTQRPSTSRGPARRRGR